MGGDGNHDGVAAPVLADQIVLGQLLLDALDVGGGLVDLVDGDDGLHACGLGMADGLDGLGHHAVIGGNHQHGDVGRHRAAQAHGSEGLVAGGVQEGDLPAVEVDGVRADVLGDAACLARSHAGLADVVQQTGLAVVDVAHDGHDRRARDQILLRVLHVLLLEGVLGGLGNLLFKLDVVLRADQTGGLVIQLVVDGGDDAQHHQLLDDLAGGLADALGQVAHGDRLGGHHGLLDAHGLESLGLGRSLLLLLSAHELVIIAVDGHVHAGVAAAVAVLVGIALRIVLAHVLLLVGIVVGYALLLHRRGEVGHLAAAIAGARTAAEAAATLTAALRAALALGTVAVGTGALLARLCRTAVLALRPVAILTLLTRLCGTAIGALGTGALLALLRRTAIGTLRACTLLARLHRTAIGALRARTVLTLLRGTLLHGCGPRGALLGLCRRLLRGCGRGGRSRLRRRFGLGLRLDLSAGLRGHFRHLFAGIGVHELRIRLVALALLLLRLAILHLLRLTGKIPGDPAQVAQHILGPLAHLGDALQHFSGIRAQFFGCVLNPDFGHSLNAPPIVINHRSAFASSSMRSAMDGSVIAATMRPGFPIASPSSCSGA